MEKPECAQLLDVEALGEQLLLRDAGPLERLVQARHGPSLLGHETDDPPDVDEQRGAVFFTVVCVQPANVAMPATAAIERPPVHENVPAALLIASVTVRVSVEAERWGAGRGEKVKVTEAEVVLVAVDDKGHPTPVLEAIP